MIALAGAVFVASLLGSLHCAGMCGAFVAAAVTSPTIEGRAARGQARLHGAYNAGRLLTYSALGGISGALGAAIDLGGAAAGLQRTAAILAGAMIATFGLVAILRLQGVRLPLAPLPSGLRTVVARAHRAASTLPPIGRAATIGMLTTLLPCGWLYAFAITAAGTASPLGGALVMVVFWAGTLPVMLSLGVCLQRVAGPLRRRVPLVTALALIGVGLYTISVRLAMPAMAGVGAPVPPEGGSELAAVERVRSLDSSQSPCCRHQP